MIVLVCGNLRAPEAKVTVRLSHATSRSRPKADVLCVLVNAVSGRICHSNCMANTVICIHFAILLQCMTHGTGCWQPTRAHPAQIVELAQQLCATRIGLLQAGLRAAEF